MAGNTRKVTLKDIAAKVGLSDSAVSRALRHPGRMNVQTEAQIRAAALELGYPLPDAGADPASGARSEAAATRDSRLVAIVLADTRNPESFQFTGAVQRRLAARRYQTVLCEVTSILTPDGFSPSFNQLHLAGIIADAGAMSDAQINLLARHAPLLAVNRKVTNVAHAGMDTERAAKELINWLHSLGHRSITFMQQVDATWATRTLASQIASAAAKSGIRFTLLEGCPPKTSSGDTLLTQLLQRPSDAVIASSNDIASGLVAAARHRGIAIPGSLSVAGFGENDHDGLVQPALTLIAPSTQELGLDAAETMLSVIQSQGSGRTGRTKPLDTVCQARLVRRSSVGPVTGTLKPSADRLPGSDEHTAKVSEPTHLTILGNSFDDWRSRLNEFARRHPSIVIDTISKDWPSESISAYWQSLRTGRDVPDLMLIEYRYLPQMVAEGAFLDIGSPVIEATFGPRFIPELWQSVHFHSKLYAVPGDFDTTVMFHRQDILDRFGFAPPRTWAEMHDMGVEMQAMDPDTFIGALNLSDYAQYLSLFTMAGHPLWHMDEDAGLITLSMTSEAVQSVARFVQRCLNERVLAVVNKRTDEFRRMLRDGRIATVVYANWFIEDIEHACAQDSRLWTVTMPPSFSTPARMCTTRYSGSALAISRQIPAAKRKAAMELAFWMFSDTNAATLCPEGLLPPSAAFHADPKVRQRIDPSFGQRLYEVFLEAVEHNVPVKPLPFMTYVDMLVRDMLLPKLRPGGDSPAALGVLQQRIAQYAQYRGYEVAIEK